MLLLVATVSWISTALILREQSYTQAALDRAEQNFTDSEVNRQRAETAAQRNETLLYVRGLGLAARAWQRGDGAAAAELMRSNPAFHDRPQLRGFEWHYLRSFLPSEHEVVIQDSVEFTSTASSMAGGDGAGGFLASGDAEGKIHIWNANTQQPIGILRGHLGPVHSLAFHPNGKSLASSGEDGTVRIWDVAQQRETKKIDGGHDRFPVFAVAYSPDGRKLASCGDDKMTRIWDAHRSGDVAPAAGSCPRRSRCGLRARRPDPGHRLERPHRSSVGCRVGEVDPEILRTPGNGAFRLLLAERTIRHQRQ